jgi:hypothetical protein
MPKNCSKVFFLCMIFAAVEVSVFGQVGPSATGHQPRLSAGGFGSVFQPDYAGNGVAQASPNPLIGIGAYFDYEVNRWFGVEGEANWLQFNQYVGINQHSYLIGPKVHIHEFGNWAPYGKFLVGAGSGSFLSGHTTVLSYGGGVDYNLSSRWVVRAADFEFQQWLVNPQIHPYGGSVGIAYRIFK